MFNLVITLLVLGVPLSVGAQSEVYNDLKETVAAEVISINDEFSRVIPGTETSIDIQQITIKFLDGAKNGKLANFENELKPLKPGQHIFVNRVETINGDEYIILMDVDRRPELVILGLLAVGLITFFAGRQGVYALFSLALSVGAILFLLVPALLAGWDPALTSLLVAGIVLALVLYITHGFKARTTIAFLGTWGAVMVTCGVAYVSVRAMHLSGMSSDAATFLNFATHGSLDFSGLLLGSIIIGILGILDDVSITQASVVQELKAANHSLNALELYKRAIRVGRDHIGSLVNTLALAYVGVSLPLVLFFARADSSLTLTLNQEIVSVEIVRIIIGSIGLVLAVPLTTAIAAYYYGKQDHIHFDPHEAHHVHTH
ncbi:MAG: hypothetical protein AUK16_01730 [Parcubacteria group bacterium CG2_30_44_11]|nr:MAG: hypothetical protein AUK16_01730 [Parcubacteria group bacterium CG2_30_44_11]